jgi:hypothetical protein
MVDPRGGRVCKAHELAEWADGVRGQVDEVAVCGLNVGRAVGPGGPAGALAATHTQRAHHGNRGLVEGYERLRADTVLRVVAVCRVRAVHCLGGVVGAPLPPLAAVVCVRIRAGMGIASAQRPHGELAELVLGL